MLSLYDVNTIFNKDGIFLLFLLYIIKPLIINYMSNYIINKYLYGIEHDELSIDLLF